MALDGNYFIDACYGRNRSVIPVWIMRQAGRFLPEYRAVRERVSFSQLCRSPRLIAEVVRQPVERFGLDAAILFSDILTMLEPMGVSVTFQEGGPVIDPPISSPDDVRRLSGFDVKSGLSFVLDAIGEIKKSLPDKPLIGFAGSPFTLACYLIEGHGSRHFNKAKSFLNRYPEASQDLINLLTEVAGRYLYAQIKAGADAVQLFQSWDGILSQEDYKQWSAQPANSIFSHLAATGVPKILFVNNIAPYLSIVKDIDCEVVGIDYRIGLSQAGAALPGKSLQGNLDPAVLLGSPNQVAEETRRVLDGFEHHDRLIFNLGHGILPGTPVESVQTMVDVVHGYRT